VSAFTRIWTTLKEVFRRLLRRPPTPGRYEEGSKFSWRGWLSVAPLVWPSRAFRLYLPTRWTLLRRAPLVMLIHGCKQNAQIIVEGTRIETVADRAGLLLLLPDQKEDANPWRCWNWFDVRTAAGGGEAAILAAQIHAVRRHYRAEQRRVVVAGISSGASIAVVLGLRFPQFVRGVFAHCGIPAGAASSPMTALTVAATGPETDVVAIGDNARRLAGNDYRPVPLCVVQGEQDSVVSPRNAEALVCQYLAFNQHPAAPTRPHPALPSADEEHAETMLDGRIVTTREWRLRGVLLVRYISIAGLGHAWSGGDDRHPYNDPRPPSATELLAAFVNEIGDNPLVLGDG